MTKHDDAARQSRRRFLATAGASGAAAIAAVGATVIQPLPATPEAATDDKRQGKGYAESAHIRNYYRTAQI